jgi:sialate O-acetylesterase
MIMNDRGIVSILAAAVVLFVGIFAALIVWESSRLRHAPETNQIRNESGSDDTRETAGASLLIEAEAAGLAGLTIGQDELASGGRFVEGFDAPGDVLRFELNLEKAGTYMIVVRYKTYGGDRPNTLKLNGTELFTYRFRDTKEWKDAVIGQFELKEGTNTMEIASLRGWIAVDCAEFIGGSGGPVRTVDLMLENGADSGPADAPVTLVARADNAAEYRFHVREAGGEWRPINEYGAAHRVIWLPPKVGAYELKVTARGLGSTAEAEAEAVLSYGAASEHEGKPLVHPLFGDHMVLQRDEESFIWGWAPPGERVTVALDGQERTATADDSGRWRVSLGVHPAGGPHTITVTSRSGKVELSDVLFGDVWLASGQSNMEWRLSQTINAAEEIRQANEPLVRFVKYDARTSAVPLSGADLRQSWQPVTPATASNLSAVAWFFAREVTRETGVPVGILFAAVGGSKIETWMSLDAVRKAPHLRASAEAVRIGAETIDALVSPTALYNGMIAPVAPYRLKGVLWYQGESNGGEASYHRMLKLWIEDWRNTFQDPELPFIIIQLSSYGSLQSVSMPVNDRSWFAVVREAQLRAVLDDPRACLVVTTDIGNPTDIHPTNKQDVGRRAAGCALGTVYGLDVAQSGPIFESMAVEGNRVRLKFRHAESGLMAGLKEGLEPVKPAPDGELLGFAVAGEDSKYYWADAEIDGDEVIVWSEQVEAPANVRYNWADSPIGNLYNGAGLPAPPFRTDGRPVLDVVSGAGGGTYDPGEIVEIIAYPPQRGRFVRWIGDTATVEDVTSRKTTIVVPNEPYTVVAPQYEPE